MSLSSQKVCKFTLPVCIGRLYWQFALPACTRKVCTSSWRKFAVCRGNISTWNFQDFHHGFLSLPLISICNLIINAATWNFTLTLPKLELQRLNKRIRSRFYWIFLESLKTSTERLQRSNGGFNVLPETPTFHWKAPMFYSRGSNPPLEPTTFQLTGEASIEATENLQPNLICSTKL